jgi:hypothetical protein
VTCALAWTGAPLHKRQYCRGHVDDAKGLAGSDLAAALAKLREARNLDPEADANPGVPQPRAHRRAPARAGAARVADHRGAVSLASASTSRYPQSTEILVV